ncbi:hypothetical protein [Pedobacter sp. GR22-6]|uniref:hypothetical protein n=1 Tax=Pedobacter sp. GR22-6 TaxID=3127957 RepID=UPI00307D28C9
MKPETPEWRIDAAVLKWSWPEQLSPSQGNAKGFVRVRIPFSLTNPSPIAFQSRLRLMPEYQQ